jgi:four helix bundle protein
MKGDDISERLIDFAVRVLRVVDSLPKSVVGRHVGLQLARSATSVGANYEEGRGAESLADFVHKVGIAWKESRESLFWLKVIHRSKLVKPQRLDPLLKECDELCAILAASLVTSRKRLRQKSPRASATPASK